MVVLLVIVVLDATSSCVVWFDATVVLSLSPSETSISLTLIATLLWCLSLPMETSDCLMPWRTDSIVVLREEEGEGDSWASDLRDEDELLRFRRTSKVFRKPNILNQKNCGRMC
jgi:hypothetical protein